MIQTYILFPLWYVLPALVGNVSALWVKNLPLLNIPVDFGLSWQGKRIFGDHKTWRGIVIGTLVGACVSLVQLRGGGIGMILTLGNFVGDLLGACIKRRNNIPSGGSSLVIDSLPSPITALLFGYLFSSYPLTLMQSISICVLIIPFHIGANRLWHFLKLKAVPW